MEAGFPGDLDMVIKIIFFLIIALFMIVAAKMIMDKSTPEFVISSFIFPSCLGLYKGKKGFSSLVIFIILAVVVFAVLLLIFFVFKGDIVAMANSIGSALTDVIPFM